MSRSIPEWIGKTDDEAVPPRVRLRIFQRQGGVCRACPRNLRSGHWDLDHIKALANGGEHRESNMQALCDVPCHSNKTADDVAQKSRSYGRALSHAGVKQRKRRSFATNKDGPFKQRMDGTVERRRARD